VTRRVIRALEVEYDDGTRVRYAGQGYANETRTPAEAQGSPVLREDDISFVTATLVYERAPAPAAP
jgi:hypothetical protein